MDDPEVAEQILAEEAQSPPAEWSPSLTEYNLTNQLLTQVIDILNVQVAATQAAAGGKPSQPKSFPRPRTQLDIIRERRSAAVQSEIIALFAPHHAR